MSSVPRSCFECRRRKIRCDRNHPCDYCTRTGAACVYPDEGSSRQQPQLPGRSSPTRYEEAMAKIQALEETVQRLDARLSAVEGRTGPTRAVATTALSLSPVLSTARSTGIVFESPIQTTFPQRVSTSSAPNSPRLPNFDYAHSAWTAFLTDIDPLFKLVDHQFVEDTLLTYPQVSAEAKALLSAIFFATAACKDLIPATEYKSLSHAVEVALQSANLLSQPSITALQALTIYLTCGRVNMDQDYLCTMLSLLVQLATRLQLHQDPAELGYLPADCEHRRRLWWHIVSLDVRTAEANGTAITLQNHQMTTLLPSVIQDRMLRSQSVSPTMQHAPCAFFAVVAIEMAELARKLLFTSAPDDDKVMRARLSDQLHEDLLNRHIAHCDCINSPICQLTVDWCRIYATRLRLLLLHWDKAYLRRTADNIDAAVADESLAACVSILERVQTLREHVEYSRWAWLWQNRVEWDASAIALSTIAAGKCSAQFVNRAWAAIDSFFAVWKVLSGEYKSQKRWRELETFRDWVRASQPLLVM